MKSTFMRAVAVVLPLLCLMLALPILTEVLPREVKSGDYHWQFWLVGAAAILGLLSARGYLKAVFTPTSGPLGTTGGAWIAWSLVGAVLASAIGVTFTVMAFWPLAVLPLLTAAMSAYLLWWVWPPHSASTRQQE